MYAERVAMNRLDVCCACDSLTDRIKIQEFRYYAILVAVLN